MVEQIAVNTLLIFGVFFATREGQVFGFVEVTYRRIIIEIEMLEYYGLSFFVQWMAKPLFMCPPCMGSFWGLSWALLYDHSFSEGMVHIIAVCGLNYVLFKFMNR